MGHGKNTVIVSGFFFFIIPQPIGVQTNSHHIVIIITVKERTLRVQKKE